MASSKLIYSLTATDLQAVSDIVGTVQSFSILFKELFIMIQQTNITVSSNPKDLILTLEHIQGAEVTLTVPARRGFYDNEGRLQAFTGIYDDGDIAFYGLAPTGEIRSLASWGVGLLASFGVSKIAGELRKQSGYGDNKIVDIATYFTVSGLIAPYIKGVADNFFGNHDFGYYNAMTNNLIFKARFGGYTKYI